MAHGAPDDSDVAKLGFICRLDDMAELAARLGSPVKYNRFGDVVYCDDFETGLGGLELSEVEPYGSIRLDTQYSLSGGVSLRLDTGDAGPFLVYVTHNNAPIETEKIGFAIAFQMDSEDCTIEFTILVYDGTTLYDFTIRYNRLLQTLRYLKPVVGTTLFAETGELEYGISLFHHAKLIINYEKREYDAFYLNQHRYDLNGCLPWSSDDTTAPHLCTIVEVDSATVYPATVFLDDLVITQNEV